MNVWDCHVQSQVFFAFIRSPPPVIIVSWLLSALGPITLVSDPGLLIGSDTGLIIWLDPGPTIEVCVRSLGWAGLARTIKVAQ